MSLRLGLEIYKMILKFNLMPESKALTHTSDEMCQRDTGTNRRSFQWPKMEQSEWQNSVVLQLTAYNKILRANTNIIDWINKWRRGEKTNLMYGTIPENLCRYSILKHLEHDSPFLQCRPHKMASFQRIQYGKRERKYSFPVEKTVTLYLSNVVKVNTNMICWHHVPFTWWDENGTLLGSFSKKPVPLVQSLQKHWKSVNREAFYKIPNQYSLKLSRISKKWKFWGKSIVKSSLKRHGC